VRIAYESDPHNSWMPSGNTLFPPLVHLCSSRMLIPSKLVTYESCPVPTSIKYSTSKNKFVHLALQNSIAIASEIVGISSVNDTLSTGIDIAIVGDNDFYSQRQNVIDLLSFVSLMKLIGCVESYSCLPSIEHLLRCPKSRRSPRPASLYPTSTRQVSAPQQH
jgi:hypothetical protein